MPIYRAFRKLPILSDRYVLGADRDRVFRLLAIYSRAGYFPRARLLRLALPWRIRKSNAGQICRF